MGGQETLLLLGQHPRLLAGAVAFDSVTDFGLRYEQFARSPRGPSAAGSRPRRGRRHADDEPAGVSSCEARCTGSRRSRDSGVPLQIWWSDADEIVVNQHTQSGRFFKELQELDRAAASRR